MAAKTPRCCGKERYDMQLIAIDNGSTGSIAIGIHGNIGFWPIPAFVQQDYTKAKKIINRIDTDALCSLISAYIDRSDKSIRCIVERPLKNPMLFEASISAARAWEATLICLEDLQIGYQVIDSKEWQKEMLPSGIGSKKVYVKDKKTGEMVEVKRDSSALKKASMEAAIKLVPDLRQKIEDHGDGDSLLMLEWARRKF
jgi:hypothetical protein